MSFEWSDLVSLSQRWFNLPDKEPEEAYLRSIISRAYYGAYGKSRNHLRDKDKRRIPRINAHEFVIQQFRSSSDPKRKRISFLLERMRDDRNKADYDDKVDRLFRTARKTVERANEVLALLATL